MEIQLTTRRATFDDVPFLLDLRRQAMNPHLEKSDVSLSDEAHRKRIDLAFDSARVIQIDGKDAGLLKCIRGAHEWELLQIQLAPPWQGAGLGAGIIGSMLQEAQQARVPLRLSVLKVNRARNLHAKLGFIMSGEDDKSFEMIWRPTGVA